MTPRAAIIAAVLVPAALPETALACGDSEAGLSCDDAGTGVEAGAKWLQNRATRAMDADRAHALDAFTKGTGGFRIADTYVSRVSPNGIMSAHLNPI